MAIQHLGHHPIELPELAVQQLEQVGLMQRGGTLACRGAVRSLEEMHPQALGGECGGNPPSIANILQPIVRVVAAAVALGFVRSQFSVFVGLVIGEILVTIAVGYALKRRLPILGPTAPHRTPKPGEVRLPDVGIVSRVEVARGQLFPVLIGSLAALSTAAVFVASRRIVGFLRRPRARRTEPEMQQDQIELPD